MATILTCSPDQRKTRAEIQVWSRPSGNKHRVTYHKTKQRLLADSGTLPRSLLPHTFKYRVGNRRQAPEGTSFRKSTKRHRYTDWSKSSHMLFGLSSIIHERNSHCISCFRDSSKEKWKGDLGYHVADYFVLKQKAVEKSELIISTAPFGGSDIDRSVHENTATALDLIRHARMRHPSGY